MIENFEKNNENFSLKSPYCRSAYLVPRAPQNDQARAACVLSPAGPKFGTTAVECI